MKATYHVITRPIQSGIGLACCLTTVVLAIGAGCVHPDPLFKSTAMSYTPPKYAAGPPPPPLCYQAEPLFYGYHAACWRAWPDGWVPCTGGCEPEWYPSTGEGLGPTHGTEYVPGPEPSPVPEEETIEPSYNRGFRLPAPTEGASQSGSHLRQTSGEQTVRSVLSAESRRFAEASNPPIKLYHPASITRSLMVEGSPHQSLAPNEQEYQEQ